MTRNDESSLQRGVVSGIIPANAGFQQNEIFTQKEKMRNQTALSPYESAKAQKPFVLFESGILEQDFILSFADAVVDFNPIHCDVKFARAQGFPNTVAHGMLSLSFIEQALRRIFGEQWRLCQIDGRFTNMLFVGQSVTGFAQVVRLCNHGGSDHMRLKFWVQRDDGVRILVGNAHMAQFPCP